MLGKTITFGGINVRKIGTPTLGDGLADNSSRRKTAYHRKLAALRVTNASLDEHFCPCQKLPRSKHRATAENAMLLARLTDLEQTNRELADRLSELEKPIKDDLNQESGASA